MACDVPSRECLHFHVQPKIPGAGKIQQESETGLYYFTARCPAHDDRKPSLRVAQGKQRRLVWYCHAGCNERAVRHALRQVGVDLGCLPRSAAELRDLEETLRDLLTSDLSHADVRLRAFALLESPDGKLPGGAALADLAAEVGVSRSGAFRARGAGVHPTTR